MLRFLEKYGSSVKGTLSGFDRLVFRGTLRALSYVGGVVGYLLRKDVRFIDYGEFVKGQTDLLTAASLREAVRCERPIRYLPSSRIDKNRVARQIAEADPVGEGLICVLKSVEPCYTYELHRDRAKKKARIEARQRKCTFLYHYYNDPQFGLMNARIQTWMPYPIQICLNGREWLARQLDRAGIAYRREDNCFSWIEDVEAAQYLMDRQLQSDWAAVLDRIASRLNPAHEEMLGRHHRYYWSTYQSEWAIDVMFGSRQALEELFPKLSRGAIVAFGADQVMRYLRGVKLVPGYDGRIVSDYRRREEGLRVKHWARNNSLKMYDKPKGVLRVETTISDPGDFRAYRPIEGQREGKRAWLRMRKGIADLHRWAEVSQAAAERYYDALAALDSDRCFGEVLDPPCHPTRWKGKRVRALRPFSPEDHRLLTAIARGEGMLNGFRNRDLRLLLHPGSPSAETTRRLSARITRQIRMLRAHGLIRKVPRTHRYLLTEKGRQLTNALLQVQTVGIQKLMELAA